MTMEQRRQRVAALFELSKDFCANAEERAAVDESWQEWCLPGLGLDIRLD
jgi:hypothetical protein